MPCFSYIWLKHILFVTEAIYVIFNLMRTILVVEDDRKISRVVKDYLEGEGFTVFTADSGKKWPWNWR